MGFLLMNHKLKCLTLLSVIFWNITFSQQKEDDSSQDNSKKIQVIPYVSYDRTYEFMLGAVPMVMYNVNKNDTISPASLSGLMGIYTTNKTWFTAFFSKLYLKEDQWRILFGAGFGNMNSQFLASAGSHHFTDIQTGADFLKLEIKRKIFSEVYLGGSYIYTKFDNEYKFDTPVEEEVTLNGLGLGLLWDKRNDVYYPNKGIKSTLNYLNYPTFLGNESQSNEINFELNKFLAMRSDKDVLALRMYTVFGLGDVPFNNLAVMGGRGSDLRGYTQGEYRGKQMLAIQGEYRYNFPNNMGLVGFAGLGSIFQSNISQNDGVLLPSVGLGYRYMAFPENKMNVGLDFAAGKDDWGIYFRIGESF